MTKCVSKMKDAKQIQQLKYAQEMLVMKQQILSWCERVSKWHDMEMERKQKMTGSNFHPRFKHDFGSGILVQTCFPHFPSRVGV